MHKKGQASSWPEVIGTLALVAGVVGPRAHGGDPGDCTHVLEEQVVQQLVLRSATSVRPGISPGFTLGTWECCSFLVPVRDACVSYEVLPPEAAIDEVLAELGMCGEDVLGAQPFTVIEPVHILAEEAAELVVVSGVRAGMSRIGVQVVRHRALPPRAAARAA